MPSTKLTFTLFLGFIAGDYTGKAVVTIQPINPMGGTLPVILQEVEFQESLTHRITITALMEEIPLPGPGVYWFDVKVNGAEKAKIPLEVLYRQKNIAAKKRKKPEIGFRMSS